MGKIKDIHFLELPNEGLYEPLSQETSELPAVKVRSSKNVESQLRQNFGQYLI